MVVLEQEREAYYYENTLAYGIIFSQYCWALSPVYTSNKDGQIPILTFLIKMYELAKYFCPGPDNNLIEQHILDTNAGKQLS
jgi:hypothetical protein